MLNKLNNSASNESSENEDYEYSTRESTPSSSNSPSEVDIGDTYYYFTHNGDSYEYRLKPHSSRWTVSRYTTEDDLYAKKLLRHAPSSINHPLFQKLALIVESPALIL